MSYTQVIRHIQRVLNQCGDPVDLIPTGVQVISETGKMSIEINRVLIKRQNDCCIISPPNPMCNTNPADEYWINRIRISPSLSDDYSNNYPMTDDEIKILISSNDLLFAYY